METGMGRTHRRHQAGWVAGIWTVILFTGAGISAFGGINEDVAQLNLDTACLADVIELFGPPLRYCYGDETFPADNLPAIYVMQYDRFDIYMEVGWIMELRFDDPASGYVWGDSIVVGSSLSSVLAQAGQPSLTVIGEDNEFLDGVLYKDIGGQTGYCYYGRSDLRVRFFFWDYAVSAIYITRSDPPMLDSDGDGLSNATEDAFGSDPFQIDTDHDGLSDFAEANFDGNATAYNPYNPDLNPGGTDLDLLARDTDGDGVADAMETNLNTNPIDPGDMPALPTGSRTALALCLGLTGALILTRRRLAYIT